MRHLTAWLADVFLGPRCPLVGCDYRGRGDRTLAQHVTRTHGTCC